MFDVKLEVPQAPLYDPAFEHDNCGIGAIVNIKGTKSRSTVEHALSIVENLEHRAGKDAEIMRFVPEISNDKRKFFTKTSCTVFGKKEWYCPCSYLIKLINLPGFGKGSNFQPEV